MDKYLVVYKDHYGEKINIVVNAETPTQAVSQCEYDNQVDCYTLESIYELEKNLVTK
ncbi:hypothetical protein [Carnobacterium divergens]|uniref:hypothetical protein n=1 Tax=Carnobacterium divergens TaxID=2748 RepID=UPI0039C8D34C